MTSKNTAGGVYALPIEDEIKFRTLSSSFRAIESKSHTILSGFEVICFAFDPHADVIVVAVPMGDLL